MPNIELRHGAYHVGRHVRHRNRISQHRGHFYREPGPDLVIALMDEEDYAEIAGRESLVRQITCEDDNVMLSDRLTQAVLPIP